MDQACALGQEISIEYRLPGPAGRVRWINSRGRLQQPVANENGRLMGISVEITERKQMEQKLQEQVREVSRLRERLERENTLLRKEVACCDENRHFTGASKCMLEIMDKIEQVADTDSTVLIQGETGTGKELIAQSIHRLSKRGKRMMVTVNCAALPAALVESELFGREKGAFTGALSKQVGRYEIADGSTLFLDEIAEMPIETQAKLLRVLQDGKFERLGSPRSLQADVRIIAATNRNLAQEVETGRFRRDLFYRLNVFPIQVPPLRERLEDIPNLVWKFVDEFGQKMGKKIRRITSRDLEMLKAYSWPGNIRELRNVIEHALIVCKEDTLKIPPLAGALTKDITPLTLAEAERGHILATLKATHGRIKGKGGAAELLRLNPSTLYSRMRKLNITPPHP
jgi:transcriptional regulator with GAF, ATPase, and Fis domain